jgi:hypothetical protein
MSTRDRRLIVVAAVFALVAVGWFLVLAPKRQQVDDLSAQVAVQESNLAAALADVAAGEAAKRDYAGHYETVARLGAAVPEDDNVASLLVQLEQAAEASDVDFRTMKVGGSSGAAAPPPPPADPAAASQVVTATLPPGASVGAAGFPTMPFSFNFTGDFFRMSDFLGRLESFLVVRDRALAVRGRFMTVDGIALTAAPEGFPRIQASIGATTYLLPASQGLTNGATPSGPAPAGGDAGGETASSGLPTPTATATPVTP